MNLRDKARLMYRFVFCGVSDTQIGNIPKWFMVLVHLPLIVGQAIPVVMRRSERNRLWDQEKTAAMALHQLQEARKTTRPLENEVHNLKEELRVTRETLLRYGGQRAQDEADRNIQKTVCYIVE